MSDLIGTQKPLTNKDFQDEDPEFIITLEKKITKLEDKLDEVATISRWALLTLIAPTYEVCQKQEGFAKRINQLRPLEEPDRAEQPVLAPTPRDNTGGSSRGIGLSRLPLIEEN